MKKIFLFFIPLLLFISCTKEIEIDLPNQAPKLVLNCFFTNDSIFSLNISKTTNFTQTLIKYISDADVKLYSGSDEICNFNYTNNGIYKSNADYNPIIGKTYSITVSSPDFPDLYAENKIPPLPDIIQITKNDSVFFDEDGYYLSEVIIYFRKKI